MKNLTTAIITLLIIISNSMFAANIKSSNDFVTTWDTTKNGTSNNTSITIPVSKGIYSYNVDWNNDGVFDDSDLRDSITHDFKEPGIYTIRISGVFPHFTFNNKGDKLKLIEVKHWGNQKWLSMNGMFWGCDNLTRVANDKPDLSNVRDMDSMFENAINFNQFIGDWDTSKIINMAGLFSGATKFNQPLNNWDTSNVNNMAFMFNKATSFNQDLNSWDTSKVNNMNAMFQLAENFNGEIGKWNTQSLTKVGFMFSQAIAFNKDISTWNTSNVVSMKLMFQGANSFNQDLNSWDVRNVNDMTKMFFKASSFDQELSNWDAKHHAFLNTKIAPSSEILIIAE